MNTLLDDAIRRVSELVEKGYITPEEILEVMTKPLRTGYNPIQDDYDWPKMPENWTDTI